MKIFTSQFFKKGNILQPLFEVCRLYMYSGTHKPFCPFCEQVYCQEKTHEINNTFEFLFIFAIAAVLAQLVFLSLSRFFLNHRSLGISGSAILGYQLFIPSVSVPIIVAVKCHKHTSLKHIGLKMFGFVTKNLNFIFSQKLEIHDLISYSQFSKSTFFTTFLLQLSCSLKINVWTYSHIPQLSPCKLIGQFHRLILF